ncbi:WhiB family transcriptional regulator [Williamsia sp. CHRR-6]|uniref:WhiB family transcriptional regulator n=1 Tax=Williamsia sp. CHRR-6 TaxID=2835871 RepID=UPI001BD9C979|nr:WhiB family transcriptional regulator [Williamsia sp. CHRR-6]MBT0568597.1 WhiB family transcriptional regulator [Williamsia sp. CHRR-6]
MTPFKPAGIGNEWEADGLCRQVDPDLWFPEVGERDTAAKRICADCPVTGECLDWALATDERFGIWGGLSPVERRRLTHHDTRRRAS